MASGYGAAGFGAGFAKGITGSLISARERERDDQRRAEDKAYEVEKFTLQTVFPQLASMAGDQDIDSIMATQFPLHFGGKKGKARLEQIKPFLLGQQGRQPGEMPGQQAGAGPQAAPPGLTAPIAASMPQAAPAPGGPATSAAAGPLAIPPGALPAPFDRPTGGALPLPPGGPQARPGEGAALPAGGAAGAAGAMAPTTNGAPADVLASRPAVSPTTPAAPATGPAAGHTFMGIPWPTSAQRATTAATQEVEADRLKMDARQKFATTAAQAYGWTPAQQAEYVATGKVTPPTAGAGYTLNPNDIRYNAANQEVARGQATTPSRGQPSEFDDFLVSFARGINKPVESLTAAERLEARRQHAEAGRAPAAAGAAADDQTAFARLAARNPVVLQGINPQRQGAVINEIAKDPALLRQYEETRMEPIRAQAQTLIGAIDQLLIVDPDTGAVKGLSPGARALFGEYTPAMARGFIPTGAAADANAALNQITGQLIVDLIRDMKAQSPTGATGFGQLNRPELDVLTTASTQLKQRLTEGQALKLLTEARQKSQKILLPSSVEVALPITIAPDATLPEGATTPAPAAAAATALPSRAAQDASGNWVIIQP